MMNDYLIMFIIFILLLVVTYFSFMYVNSDKNSRYSILCIIVYLFVGIPAIRLSMTIDELPTTIMVLYSIVLALFKTRDTGEE